MPELGVVTRMCQLSKFRISCFVSLPSCHTAVTGYALAAVLTKVDTVDPG